MTQTKWWESTYEAGAVKLRIKSFLIVLIPLLNTLGEKYGVNLIREDLDILVDSIFVIWFAIVQIWGWLRTFQTNNTD